MLLSEFNGMSSMKVALIFASRQKPVFTPAGMWEKESPYISVLREEKILKRLIAFHKRSLGIQDTGVGKIKRPSFQKGRSTGAHTQIRILNL